MLNLINRQTAKASSLACPSEMHHIISGPCKHQNDAERQLKTTKYDERWRNTTKYSINLPKQGLGPAVPAGTLGDELSPSGTVAGNTSDFIMSATATDTHCSHVFHVRSGPPHLLHPPTGVLWKHKVFKKYKDTKQWRRSTSNIGGDIPSLSFPFPPSLLPFPLPFPLPLLPFPSLPLPSLPFPHPSPPPYWRLEGLGERLSSPSGSGQSPAAKRILVHFGSKLPHFMRLITVRVTVFTSYSTWNSSLQNFKQAKLKIYNSARFYHTSTKKSASLSSLYKHLSRLWNFKTPTSVCRWPASALSLIHIWRCRRSYACRSRWSPYH